MSGGGGIRTLGTAYAVQRFSRPPRSTTPAPLQGPEPRRPRRGSARLAIPQKRPQLPQHASGVLADVVPGVATELVASPVSLAFAATVSLPCMSAVVEAVAVQLHGERVLRPAAVDIAATGFAVRLRQRQALFP